MKHFKKLFWLTPFLGLFIFTGCKNTTGTETGIIEGSVYIVGTSIPISGVTVSCAGINATTSGDGYYELENVPSGQQTVNATKSDFENYSKTIEVSTGTNTHDIEMTSSPSAPDLSGHVYSELDGDIQGAEVSIPPLGLKDWTDATGNYQIPNVPQGEYPIKVTHDNYDTFEDSVYLYSSDKQFNVRMLRQYVIQLSATKDAYTYRWDPDSCFGEIDKSTLFVYTGSGGGSTIYAQTYISFNLNELPSYFSLNFYDSVVVHLTAIGGDVFRAKLIMQDWDELSITWNNSPEVGENHTSRSGSNSRLNITEIFQEWYDNQNNRYGIVLYATGNTDYNHSIKWYSKEAGYSPVLKVFITY